MFRVLKNRLTLELCGALLNLLIVQFAVYQDAMVGPWKWAVLSSSGFVVGLVWPSREKQEND